MQVVWQVLLSILFMGICISVFSKYISLGVGVESNAIGLVAIFHMVRQCLLKHVPVNLLDRIYVCVIKPS